MPKADKRFYFFLQNKALIRNLPRKMGVLPLPSFARSRDRSSEHRIGVGGLLRHRLNDVPEFNDFPVAHTEDIHHRLAAIVTVIGRVNLQPD